jgi:hypothetical protein
MAAKAIMHDELTGVTLLLEDDETTELMTVIINGHEVLIPEEAHKDLYQSASNLQDMMRTVKEAFIGKGDLTHTEAYLEFNEAAFTFADKRNRDDR